MKHLPVLVLAVSLTHVSAQAQQESAPSAPETSPNYTVHNGGGPVKAPVLIHMVAPQYTEDAHKNHFAGNVQVYLWVDEHGNPSHVRVIRGVGMGLDERAVEAVRQYKFKPAMQDGKPVKVDMYIDVNFREF